MLASSRVVVAILRTTSRAIVFLRNYTLQPDADVALINQLAEALHAVPAMASQLEYFRDEDGLIETVRTHLGGFSITNRSERFNLVEVFEDELSRA